MQLLQPMHLRLSMTKSTFIVIPKGYLGFNNSLARTLTWVRTTQQLA
jgi:hypothetical protein